MNTLTRLSRLSLLVALITLSACASVEKTPSLENKLSSSEIIKQLGQHLPGHYSNFSQQWRQPQQALHLLDISLLKAGASEIWLLSRQRAVNNQNSNDQSIRQQILSIRANEKDEITFRFAPHKGDAFAAQQAYANGITTFLPGCEITLFPGTNGLLGKSSASDCKLPSATGNIGLSKSIKLEAGIITIADQLSLNGVAQGEANVQQFYRSHTFTGWAGFKRAQTDWQTTRPFDIHSDGEVLALIDSEGQASGIQIRLSQVAWKKGEQMILRLDLIDPDSGNPTAYAFTDPEAESIGINLGEVQVGLKRK